MSMHIYIVRHGPALDVGEDGIRTDAKRPLSAEGREKTQAVAQGFAKLDCPVTAIYSSPLVRAEETARLFRAVLSVDEEVALVPWLVPGGSTMDAVAAWHEQQAQGTKGIMCVGHMPDVAGLLNACLPKEQQHHFQFKKAAVAHVCFPGEVAVGQGQLVQFYTPRALRVARWEEDQ